MGGAGCFGALAAGTAGFPTPVVAAGFFTAVTAAGFFPTAVPAAAADVFGSDLEAEGVDAAGAVVLVSGSFGLNSPKERFFFGATWAPPFFFPDGCGVLAAAGAIFAGTDGAGFVTGTVFLTRGGAPEAVGSVTGSAVLLTGAVGRCRFFFSILLVDAVDVAGSGSWETGRAAPLTIRARRTNFSFTPEDSAAAGSEIFGAALAFGGSSASWPVPQEFGSAFQFVQGFGPCQERD